MTACIGNAFYSHNYFIINDVYDNLLWIPELYLNTYKKSSISRYMAYLASGTELNGQSNIGA